MPPLLVIVAYKGLASSWPYCNIHFLTISPSIGVWSPVQSNCLENIKLPETTPRKNKLGSQDINRVMCKSYMNVSLFITSSVVYALPFL